MIVHREIIIHIIYVLGIFSLNVFLLLCYFAWRYIWIFCGKLRNDVREMNIEKHSLNYIAKIKVIVPSIKFARSLYTYIHVTNLRPRIKRMTKFKVVWGNKTRKRCPCQKLTLPSYWSPACEVSSSDSVGWPSAFPVKYQTYRSTHATYIHRHNFLHKRHVTMFYGRGRTIAWNNLCPIPWIVINKICVNKTKQNIRKFLFMYW